MKTITLANLAGATRQGIFNQVVNHARKQNKKSIGRSGYCQYRDGFGNSCFVGCLVSDEEYADGKIIEGTISGQPGKQFRRQHYFITDLQYIHDNCGVDEWENNFIKFASNWDLTYFPKQ